MSAGTTQLEREPVVEVGWVADHLDDPGVRIVEVDVSGAAYGQGHIPGAVLWNAYTDLRHPDYSLVGIPESERLLSKSGVSVETTVVFHGYGAHLGLWLLRAYGHRHVRLLDGPRTVWPEAGHSWSAEAVSPEPTSYALDETDPALHSSAEELEAMIGSAVVILDVRSQAEYDGDFFWPSGAPESVGRPGHIPGSVHVPIESFRTEAGGFREPREMRRVLADHAIKPDQRIVTYCTVGNRASQAWFALTQLLGYPDVGVYYGSWAEWGFRPGSPIESVASRARA